MKTNHRQLKSKSYITSLFVIIGAFFLVSCTRHPSDEEMIKKFNQCRTTFEKLSDMLHNDNGLHRVANDFTRPPIEQLSKYDITSKRIHDYRKLFNEINCTAGVRSNFDNSIVYIIESTWGLSISGSVKGYVHMLEKKPNMRIVKNLDNVKAKDDELVYRHLDDGWYLYYEIR